MQINRSATGGQADRRHGAQVAQQDHGIERPKGHQYPQEYLTSIKDGCLPAHILRRKIGAPIIALRNITESVSNGTRMVVTRLRRNSTMFARVLLGPRRAAREGRPEKGREVAITRVFTTHDMGAFELQRRQLPIRVTFAMTISKA